MEYVDEQHRADDTAGLKPFDALPHHTGHLRQLLPYHRHAAAPIENEKGTGNKRKLNFHAQIVQLREQNKSEADIVLTRGPCCSRPVAAHLSPSTFLHLVVLLHLVLVQPIRLRHSVACVPVLHVVIVRHQTQFLRIKGRWLPEQLQLFVGRPLLAKLVHQRKDVLDGRLHRDVVQIEMAAHAKRADDVVNHDVDLRLRFRFRLWFLRLLFLLVRPIVGHFRWRLRLHCRVAGCHGNIGLLGAVLVLIVVDCGRGMIGAGDDGLMRLRLVLLMLLMLLVLLVLLLLLLLLLVWIRLECVPQAFGGAEM
uniref:Uncharacterized protein n=1 Tax=Anopheles farauti TaxID=69004 RepID=A0A182QDK0_9DIPT